MAVYPIYDWFGPVGELNVCVEGLYARITANLPQNRKLMRLWLAGERALRLGTPMPAGNGLHYCSRVSVRQLPAGLAGGFVTEQEEGQWLTGSGQRCRLLNGQAELAQPYRENGEVPFLSCWRQVHTEVIQESLWIVRRIALGAWLEEQKTVPR